MIAFFPFLMRLQYDKQGAALLVSRFCPD